MKPSARIEAIIEVLSSEHRSRVPLDRVVGDYVRPRRYIGSKDRKAIVERIYDMTRAHARIGWWLANKTKAEDTARTRVLVWLVMAEQCDEKYILSLYDGSSHSPAPLSEDESAALEALLKNQNHGLVHPDMPDMVRLECPPEYEQRLRDVYGDQFDAEMSAMIDGAHLDMFVNTMAVTRENVIASMEKHGHEVVETPYSPYGLRALEKLHLSKTKPFIKGWIAIQDEGSQLIPVICDARPGMQVLDYCAGAGGKSLGLAINMQGKGRLVAMDTDSRRLAKAKPRFRRAGLGDNIEMRSLEDEKNRKWLRRQKESFDVVLADVPCTGSGTWRRNPDSRWTVYGPPLEELIVTQREILSRIEKVVKPGGRLVYATCSILPDENEQQVAWFLKEYPDFTLKPVKEAWPEDLECKIEGDVMRLSPLRYNTDGFFAAVFERKE